MGAEGNVRAAIGYTERTGKKPYFYANAHEKDYVPLKPAEMDITDARGLDADLDREGFVLVQHKSAVDDLTDLDAVNRVHAGEIAELLKRLTGCDHVEVMPRGILRFSERLGENEQHDNSHPARMAHVDMSKEAAAEARSKGAPEGRKVVRSAQYNVWRALSPWRALADAFVWVREQSGADVRPLAEYPERVGRWIVGIGVHKAHRKFRRRKLMRALGLDRSIDDERLVVQLAGDAGHDARLELARIDEALDAMPSVERLCFVLRRLEGYPLEEVATLTGVSLATVKRKLTNAERVVARIREEEPS